MKSYLIIWFNSEGANPSEITRALTSLGFKPIKGNYDYVYEWNTRAEVDEVLAFADKVKMTLSGMKVLFKIETVE
jgi:hypothetical protein